MEYQKLWIGVKRMIFNIMANIKYHEMSCINGNLSGNINKNTSQCIELELTTREQIQTNFNKFNYDKYVTEYVNKITNRDLPCENKEDTVFKFQTDFSGNDIFIISLKIVENPHTNDISKILIPYMNGNNLMLEYLLFNHLVLIDSFTSRSFYTLIINNSELKTQLDYKQLMMDIVTGNFKLHQVYSGMPDNLPNPKYSLVLSIDIQK